MKEYHHTFDIHKDLSKQYCNCRRINICIRILLNAAPPVPEIDRLLEPGRVRMEAIWVSLNRTDQTGQIGQNRTGSIDHFGMIFSWGTEHFGHKPERGSDRIGQRMSGFLGGIHAVGATKNRTESDSHLADFSPGCEQFENMIFEHQI